MRIVLYKNTGWKAHNVPTDDVWGIALIAIGFPNSTWLIFYGPRLGKVTFEVQCHDSVFTEYLVSLKRKAGFTTITNFPKKMFVAVNEQVDKRIIWERLRA
jgi:ABC-type uncharacterized transport system fused permease/ATPase subunit